MRRFLRAIQPDDHEWNAGYTELPRMKSDPPAASFVLPWMVMYEPTDPPSHAWRSTPGDSLPTLVG